MQHSMNEAEILPCLGEMKISHFIHLYAEPEIIPASEQGERKEEQGSCTASKTGGRALFGADEREKPLRIRKPTVELNNLNAALERNSSGKPLLFF